MFHDIVIEFCSNVKYKSSECNGFEKYLETNQISFSNVSISFSDVLKVMLRVKLNVQFVLLKTGKKSI